MNLANVGCVGEIVHLSIIERVRFYFCGAYLIGSHHSWINKLKLHKDIL